MNKKGFSLIELLAVLIILALITVLVSSLVTNTINNAKLTITDAQERSILNAAEKWSVDNSQVFDDIEAKQLQIGLDVVFILDISGSMGYKSNRVLGTDGTKISRYEAMIIATNEALKILLPQNSENRVGLIAYGSSTSTWLPLNNYYSTGEDYVTWTRGYNSSGHDWGTVNFPTLYKKGGSKVSSSYKITDNSTYTQLGIVNGAKMLLNTSPNEAKDRIPVVILLTDGIPNGHNTSLCSICSSNTTGLSSSYYYTVMAGYEYRNKIESHYQNGNGGENVSFFYTIGFGIDSTAARKILDPGSFNETKDYNYVTKAYLDGQMSTEELQSLFSHISNEVVAATKITQVCVTVQDLYDGGYLSTKDIDLASGEAASTYVIMNYNEATNQYKFDLAKTSKQKSDCEKLLSQS